MLHLNRLLQPQVELSDAVLCAVVLAVLNFRGGVAASLRHVERAGFFFK